VSEPAAVQDWFQSETKDPATQSGETSYLIGRHDCLQLELWLKNLWMASASLTEVVRAIPLWTATTGGSPQQSESKHRLDFRREQQLISQPGLTATKSGRVQIFVVMGISCLQIYTLGSESNPCSGLTQIAQRLESPVFLPTPFKRSRVLGEDQGAPPTRTIIAFGKECPDDGISGENMYALFAGL
jgi:hypothetical protein